MNLTNVLKYLRMLAKDEYYQTIYVKSKEYGFKLFKNDIDFTRIQMEFLSLLSFHNSLETDIALGEVDESVREYETYEDSYMYYKMKERGEKKNLDYPDKYDNKYNRSFRGREKLTQTSKSQWVFKKPKKVNE